MTTMPMTVQKAELIVPSGPGRQLDPVALLESAERAIEQASTIPEAKQVLDQVQTIRDHSKRLRLERGLQNLVAACAIKTQRKLGAMLAEMPMPHGRPGKRSHDVTLLSDVGISKMQSYRWQLIAGIPERDFQAFVDEVVASERELTTASVLKLAKRLKAAQTSGPAAQSNGSTSHVYGSLDELIATERKFSTVYADPPWRYDNQATRAATDNHYPTMTVDKIAAMPVNEVVAENAHLHLWTTVAFAADAFEIIKAWGFTYKSQLIWVKPQMGIGNYWRVSHEILLFAVRGSCPFLAHDERSWIEAPRGRHSAKPDLVRSRIEKVSPGEYLEMFGRKVIRGWAVLGNQVDVGPALLNRGNLLQVNGAAT